MTCVAPCDTRHVTNRDRCDAFHGTVAHAVIPLLLLRGKPLAFVTRMRATITTVLTIGAGALCASRLGAQGVQDLHDVLRTHGLRTGDSAFFAAAGTSFTTPGARRLARIDSAVAVARSQLGRRYVYGAEGTRGFDCSGLVRYVLRAVSIDAPRTAQLQAKLGTSVPLDTAHLRPGDLLTFGTKRRVTHIGIYVGNGRFVHASSGAGRIVERPLLRRPARGIKPWIGARRVLSDDRPLPATVIASSSDAAGGTSSGTSSGTSPSATVDGAVARDAGTAERKVQPR